MIYCVEDDDNIRELVIYTLETTGLKARGFAEGSAFMETLAFDTPELILLDIMLPGDDGLELLKKLKSSPKTKGIPVIMVTAKGTEYDKVVGLDSGADDYVTKPFGMMELVSRIKAVLRRSGKVEDRIDMVLTARKLGVRSIPVNVLNPIPGTPYEKNPVLSGEEILRCTAVFRFLIPDGLIRLAGGRGLMEDKGKKCFQSGANAAISGDMLTTAGITVESDMEMIRSLGYKVSL